MLLLYEQAQRRNRRRRFERLVDMNAAFAGGDNAKALFKELSKEE